MRRSSPICLLLTLLPLSGITAQPISNSQVHAFVVSDEPHHKGSLHEHAMNRVMIYLDPGHQKISYANGKVEDLRLKAGEVRWSPASGPHTSENTGDKALRIVEVELKTKPAEGSVNTGALDPVKVDPKRYKIEFENQQVRVLRVRYGPHEKGVLHKHTLNRVVTYLTDEWVRVTTADGKSEEVRRKAGDVSWGGQAEHVEENLSDQPFEVVVVELKS